MGLGRWGLHNKTIAGTAETMVLASTQHVFEHLTPDSQKVVLFLFTVLAPAVNKDSQGDRAQAKNKQQGITNR